jgi:hypothetical protein
LAAATERRHSRLPTTTAARCVRTCASPEQALSEGEGLSLSSSTLKLRIHSAQSSLVTRWLLSQARRSTVAFTVSLGGGPGGEKGAAGAGAGAPMGR